METRSQDTDSFQQSFELHLKDMDVQIAQNLLRQQQWKADSKGCEDVEPRRRGIQLQKSMLNLYCGNYNTSHKDLQHISHRYGASNERDEILKCFSLSLIHHGRYTDVKAKLGETVIQWSQGWNLKDSLPDTRVAIECLLAQAHLYSGEISTSEERLEDARQVAEQNRDGIDNAKMLMIVAKTHAQIQAILGNYDEGFRSTQRAMELTQYCFGIGKYHKEVLQLLAQNAYFLSFKMEHTEAEITCRDAITRMTNELGGKHPATLEAKYILVVILRNQGRIAESTALIKDVVTDIKTLEELPVSHLLVIQAYTELAINHRLMGDYQDGSDLLHLAIDNITKESASPSIFQSIALTELAHIELHLGNTGLAYERSLDSFSQLVNRGDVRVDHEIVKHQVAAVSSKIEAMTRVTQPIGDIFYLGDNNEGLRCRVCRPLLRSMEVIALCTLQVQPKAPGKILFMQRAIWSWTRSRYSALHFLTLESEYQFCLTFKRKNRKSAAESLRLTFWRRFVALGSTHRDTLETKRELIMEHLAFDRWEDLDSSEWTESLESPVTDITKEDAPPCRQTRGNYQQALRHLEEILNLQEGRLGMKNPSTLRTLFCITKVHAALGKDAFMVKPITDMILERLQAKGVQRQRGFEAKGMQREINSLFAKVTRMA